MIKKLIAVLLVAMPAGAQAMGMHDGMRGCAPGMGMHLAAGLYAVLAALGYLVLQHAAKDAVNYSKRAGQVVGWVLIVAGLGGLLCGIANHARTASCNRCAGQGQMMQREGMPGMMGMEGMGEMRAAPEMKASPEAKPAAAKKK